MQKGATEKCKISPKTEVVVKREVDQNPGLRHAS